MSTFFPSTPSMVSSLNREHSTSPMNHFHNTQAPQSLRTPTCGMGMDHSSLTTSSRSSSYPMLPPAQPQPQALTSLLNLPEQLGYEQPGYDPTDYQDIDTGLGGHGLGGDPSISSAFIEAVAQSMGFLATDKDYRSSLHSIPKIAPGMSVVPSPKPACRSDHTIMSNVHTHLEETFAFTPEQKVNIHLVSGELLLDPNQVRYTQMSIDVEIRIYGPDEDISQPSSAMLGITSQHNSKKHKHTGNSLPHLNRNDFWSMVEKWFASRMQQNQLRMSWTSPGWTKYIEETLRQGCKKFKPIPILNPFLTNFNELAGTGDDNEVVQPHTSSAIGSMQGIIGIL
ncbi:hypothetical protein EDB85DRAFT_2159148 [Lactarius pseudohatsudake]|nr:hypothetical protein EDB85DRAFT_2159148 [Lactarius pseudohatsudake]